MIKYLELIGLNTELNLKGSKFYSTIGVAFKLNIKLDTVKELIEDDKLKSKQIENQYWIREEHLKAYLEDDLQI